MNCIKKKNGRYIVPENQELFDAIYNRILKIPNDKIMHDPAVLQALNSGHIKSRDSSYYSISNQDMALVLWAKTFTPSFREWYGEGPIKLNDSGNFENNIGQERTVVEKADWNYDDIFYSLEPGEAAIYLNQIDDATPIQKEKAELLLRRKKNMSIEDDYYYVKGKKKPFMRSTMVINKQSNDGDDSYYAFKGEDPDKFEINREWGHEADEILTAVILGRDPKTKHFSPKVVSKLRSAFKKFVDENPNSIILTQVPNFVDKVNEEDLGGYAGTMDIVLVDPDGSIRIIDLKTSVHPTKEGKSAKYLRQYDGGASKKERHDAQLSIYRGMAEYHGISVTDTMILPVHLTEVDEKSVDDVNVEPIFTSYSRKDFYLLGNPRAKIATNRRGELVTQIKNMIANRRNLATKLRQKFRAQQFQDLLEDLHWATETEAIKKFIDNTFEQVEFLERGVKSIKNQEMNSPLEALNNINFYRSVIDAYDLEMLRELRDYLLDHDIKVEQGSSASNLIELIIKLEKMKSFFSKESYGYLADVLLPELKSKSAEFKKAAEIKRKRLQIKEKALTTALKKKGLSEKEIQEKLEEKYKADRKEVEKLERKVNPDKQLLIEEIKAGNYEDINWADYFFNSSINQDNNILAGYMKTVKRKFTEARLKAMDVRFEAEKVYDEFKKWKGSDQSVSKFNEDLLQEVTAYDHEGNEYNTLHFVSPYDFNVYNKAYKIMIDKVAKNPDNAKKIKKEFFEQHTEKRPENDIKLNGVTVVEGWKTVIRKHENEIKKMRIKDQEKAATIFLNRNKHLFRVPKAKNPKWEQLKNKPQALKYYSFLIDRYFKDQDKVAPRDFQDMFMIPAIAKTTYDRIQNKGIKRGIEYKFKDMFSVLKEDEEIFGSPDLKVIPTLYSFKMDKEDVSQDLMGSILIFHMAAEKHKVRNELDGFSNLLIEAVKASSPNETNKFGEAKKGLLSKYLGVDVESYAKKHGNNYVAAVLEASIEKHIHGKKVTGSKQAHKVSNTVMGYTSLTQIAVNPVLSVSNALQANAMALVEAAAGEFFTLKEWTSASAEYVKHGSDFFKDNWTRFNKSKIGQLVDAYDVIQGEVEDEFGRKFAKTNLKRHLNAGTLYKLQSASEHQAQVTAFIALMKQTKVKQHGESISLWDAYDMKDGKLTLKEGVILSDKLGVVDNNTMNQIHAINKRLHGVYNDFDSPIIERAWWGKLLSMYKKFIYPGFKKRFKAVGVDHELDGITEGFYTTFFYKMLFKEGRELLNMITPGAQSSLTLTDYEKANVRRAVTELVLIGATTLLAAAMTAIMESSDDEEKNKWAYLAYISRRLNTELSFFMGPDFVGAMTGTGDLVHPQDAIRLIRTPAVSYSVLEKGLNLIYQAGDPFAKYERDYGLARKGNYKLPTKFLKFIGISGQNFHPEEALRIYESTTR